MMDARRNGLVLLALLLLTQTTISAQTDSMGKDVPIDSVSVATSDSLQTKRSFFKKFLDYFNDANKEKKNKKFDFSVIGGPHYSSDTKLGLGLVAAGQLDALVSETLALEDVPANLERMGGRGKVAGKLVVKL